MVQPHFEIEETKSDGRIKLSLRGELDFASTQVPDDRLARLRGRKLPVRLDLSRLEFIDSTGLHLLVRSMGDARTDGWELQIDPEVSQTVSRLFKLVHFDPFSGAARA
jgi:anti-anti-sigma factor